MNRENAEAWRLPRLVAAKDGDELAMHQSLDRATALDPEATLAWVRKESPELPALKVFLA